MKLRIINIEDYFHHRNMDLDLCGQFLEKIPNELPKNLKDLDCSINCIIKIENLPKNLKEFDCSNNQIKVIQNLPKSLKVFDCSSNQIKVIENLPINLETFYVNFNQITKIENLPLGLKTLFFDENKIIYVDNVEYKRINFTLHGYQAIRRIQRRIKLRFKRNKAARII